MKPESGSTMRHDVEARKRANRALLDAVAALWDKVPEQRFGQLIMNLSREPGGFADTWEWKHGTWHDRVNQWYWRDWPHG